MPSLQEELSKSLYLYTSGSSIEAVRGEDGVTRAMVVEEVLGAGVAAKDQTDPFAIAGEVEPMSVGDFAEKTGEMAAGAVGGASAVTLGFPGDLIGLAEGLYGAATSEEGERLDAFLQNMAARSEQMGSAMTIGTLEEMIKDSDLSPQTKENMLAGSKYLGEWAELPGGITAASALLRGARGYAAGAPARAAERGTGTTLQSGVDPMAAVDEAIVGIQNITGTGARAPVEKDQLGFVQKALEVTKNLQQKRGTAQQFLKRLTQNGVSEDEIQALGLREKFSNPNERITRDQFEQAIRDRRIELEEVVRGVDPDDFDPEQAGELRFNQPQALMDPAEWEGQTLQYLDDVSTGEDYAVESVIDYLRANSDRFNEEELAALQQQLKDGEYRQLPSTIQSDLNDAAEAIAQEEYMQDPIVRSLSDEADYEIVGNDNTGYTVIFEGNPLENSYANSIEEAQIQAAQHAYDNNILEGGGGADESSRALFEQYMLPGGDEYQEVLIKDPSTPGGTSPDHWSEGDVIGHALIKRRTDAQGRDIVYAEELQSDWAQSARANLSRTTERAEKRIQANQTMIEGLDEKIASGSGNLTQDELIAKKNEYLADIEESRADIARANERFTEEQGKLSKTRFVKDTQQWLRPTLKRLIAKAIEDGADAVAVPPHQVVHKRWNDDYGDFYRKTVPNTLLKVAKQLDPKVRITKSDLTESAYPSLREEAAARGLRPSTQGMDQVTTIQITDAMRKAYEQKGQSLFVGAPTAIIGGKMAFDAATREQEDDSR